MSPRALPDIISHIRMCVASPEVVVTCIRDEDLTALCDAAERSQPVAESTAQRPSITVRIPENSKFEIDPALCARCGYTEIQHKYPDAFDCCVEWVSEIKREEKPCICHQHRPTCTCATTRLPPLRWSTEDFHVPLWKFFLWAATGGLVKIP